VAVIPQLRAALLDARNWASELPGAENPLVSFRDVRLEGARLVHPLAALTVRQKVVPLDTPVARFGATRPSDGTRFSVTVAAQDGGLAAEPVEDPFAPAQFQNMSDEEKLTGRSFVPLRSGWRFAAERYAFDYDDAVRAYDVNITYETVTVLAQDGPAAASAPHRLPDALLQRGALIGAAGQAAIRRTGTERYRADAPVTV